MAENVFCMIGDALISLYAAQYYQNHQDEFGDTVALDGQNVTYAATSAPQVTITGDAAQNITVSFPSVTITPPGVDPFTVGVSATGTVAVSGGVLQMTSIEAAVTGAGDWLDGKLGKLTTSQIQSRYASKVADLPIPAFNNILDSKFSIALSSATTSAGFARASGALTYAGQQASGTAADMPTIGNESAAVVAITPGGVQTAMLSMQSDFPKVKKIDQSSTWAASGYGISGTSTITFPRIDISGSVATVTCDVYINVSAGIEAIGIWSWTPLPCPPATVVLTLAAISSPDNVQITVSFVQSITYPQITFPSGPIGDLSSDLLSMIESEVSSHIESAVVGVTVPLMSFPSELTGPSSLVDPPTFEFDSSFAQCFISQKLAPPPPRRITPRLMGSD